jgi:hypothetical protein
VRGVLQQDRAELKKNNIPNEWHLWTNSLHVIFNDAAPERNNKWPSRLTRNLHHNFTVFTHRLHAVLSRLSAESAIERDAEILDVF